ncbi:MAG: SGNH/GDSL hydrolase family protein [Bacteroidia bacterium]
MVLINKDIDLSRFVAIGDSVTSGYRDGALFYKGQLDSFPRLMAEQFKTKQKAEKQDPEDFEFRQPLMHPGSPGLGFWGNSRLVLKKRDDGAGSELSYLAPAGDLQALATNIYSSQGPFHNLGVPGAKVTTLAAPGYGDPAKGMGNYNPFFFRMSSDPVKASILSDALRMRPTFFSLFIGNNDALAYALSGGTSDSITPLADFKAGLELVIDALLSAGARGALSNLPGLESIPFFTSIPYNGLLLDRENRDQLNLQFPGTVFVQGLNSFLVEDPFHPGGKRQLEKGELVILDVLLDENRYSYLQGLIPIPEKYYLSKEQVEQVRKAIAAFNEIIKALAIQKQLAFIDTELFLRNIATARVYDPRTLCIEYASGDVFSLDGLHINSLGHSLLANEFIVAINKSYNAGIPKINITRFREHN